MTRDAGIWDSYALALRRGDEFERVTGDIHLADCLGDPGHMAGHALASGTIRLVMGVFCDACRMRSILRIGTVAGRTDFRGRLAQHGVVLRTMRIVTAKTCDATVVHQALRKIVPLHPVLVRRAVREMCEGHFPRFVLFQFPVIRKHQTCSVANGPVVILSVDRIGQRLALRMALDTGVIRLDEVLPGGI